MEVSSCGKQEGVILRYILAMGTTIDYFFFSKSTRLPHQFITFADSSLVSLIFLYGSVDCKTVSVFSKSFYCSITRALEYAKTRTVLQSNGAELGAENREIQLIICYTRTAIQQEGQDEKVRFLTAHSSLNTNQRALG